MICNVAVRGGRDDETFPSIHGYISSNVDSILRSYEYFHLNYWYILGYVYYICPKVKATP